jgi:hypothetical protein
VESAGVTCVGSRRKESNLAFAIRLLWRVASYSAALGRTTNLRTCRLCGCRGTNRQRIPLHLSRRLLNGRFMAIALGDNHNQRWWRAPILLRGTQDDSQSRAVSCNGVIISCGICSPSSIVDFTRLSYETRGKDEWAGSSARPVDRVDSISLGVAAE